jgi:hypothetical protein
MINGVGSDQLYKVSRCKPAQQRNSRDQSCKDHGAEDDQTKGCRKLRLFCVDRLDDEGADDHVHVQAECIPPVARINRQHHDDRLDDMQQDEYQLYPAGLLVIPGVGRTSGIGDHPAEDIQRDQENGSLLDQRPGSTAQGDSEDRSDNPDAIGQYIICSRRVFAVKQGVNVQLTSLPGNALYLY